MHIALDDNPWLVPFDGGFRVADARSTPLEESGTSDRLKQRLARLRRRLDDQQRMLYARRERAVLLVFQAMDAAGKDGTLRAVFRRIDPNGCRVWSFKAPSDEERARDFLWRTSRRLPAKGMIGIFNRSYYEEVLVVRVHPEYLAGQHLAPYDDLATLWDRRYRAIRDHERHLAESGTIVVKFWLNVSRDEQARRFISRIEEEEKRWKFSFGDVEERERWPEYMAAYEDALNATSRPWAPWYAVPADDKRYLRVQVAEIVAATLERLGLAYPKANAGKEQELLSMRRRLEREIETLD